MTCFRSSKTTWRSHSVRSRPQLLLLLTAVATCCLDRTLQEVRAFVPTTSSAATSKSTTSCRSVAHSQSTGRPTKRAVLVRLYDAESPLVDGVATEAGSATVTATSAASVDAVLDTPPPIAPPPLPTPTAPVDTSIPALSPPALPDMDTIGLVAGQENYGLAIVLFGEGIWSFAKAPSVDHALKTLLPSGLAAACLVLVSGPAITSGSSQDVATGLSVATAVSVVMGVAYAARLAAPYSPSPKEIPALGLLVALAGFFSFGQNLIVDGFVTLPSIPLPSLPTIELPF